MTGLIWFVQIVHYPLMASVPKDGFRNYELRHRNLTTYVVLLPMMLELLSSFVLIFYSEAFMSRWETVLGASLVTLIWFSTAFLQVPAHSVLAQGFRHKEHSQLLKSNWLRTTCWTLRSALVLIWLSRLLALNTPHS